MAITYLSTNESTITTIIDSQSFRCYIQSVQAQLHLNNTNYIIEISDELPKDAQGYVKTNTNASTEIATNKIIVYPEIIAKNINNKFAKFTYGYEDIFDRIVLLFIQFVYAHELTHLKQIENGSLTQEIIKEHENIDYYNRPYEINANNTAQRILSQYGEFEISAIESILSKMYNPNLTTELIELYNNQFNQQ